jgi:hypothetical protein
MGLGSGEGFCDCGDVSETAWGLKVGKQCWNKEIVVGDRLKFALAALPTVSYCYRQ